MKVIFLEEPLLIEETKVVEDSILTKAKDLLNKDDSVL